MAENPTQPTASTIVDGAAIAIGELYERSNLSFADAVIARLECGRLLAEKKASTARGKWLPWLEANAGVLGFETARTAQRLIKSSANTTPASHLDAPTMLKLSREMWGHESEGVHVAANSGENEWYTPPDILNLARNVLGSFDLDPASSVTANKSVGAAKIFTVEDDGLSAEWPRGVIFMNPPYSQPLIGQFCERFADEIKRGSTGISLVNNATETRWFQSLARASSAMCFPLSRIKFLNPEGNPGGPLQGQAIIYCGPRPVLFEREFADVGFVVRVSR